LEPERSELGPEGQHVVGVGQVALRQGHLREHRTIPSVPPPRWASVPFNNRKGTDANRFALAPKGIINERLTQVALTGSALAQTC
jgi:hypothetical protein